MQRVFSAGLNDMFIPKRGAKHSCREFAAVTRVSYMCMQSAVSLVLVAFMMSHEQSYMSTSNSFL